jgi:hypothetical protein
MLCVSFEEQRSPKFIMSVVLDVPCVHESWLDWCLETRELEIVDEFLLPVGFSLSQRKLVFANGLGEARPTISASVLPYTCC